jgi:hypothetical protein
LLLHDQSRKAVATNYNDFPTHICDFLELQETIIVLIDCKFNPFFPYNNAFMGKTHKNLRTGTLVTGVVKLKDKP